jgi:hypothetical protein
MEYSDQTPPDLFSMSPVPAASAMIRANAIAAPPGYTSPRSRARWALALLGVTVAAEMLSLLALGLQRSLLDRGLGQITLSEWQTSTGRVSHLATVELILYVVTAIAFLLWLHRCYRNVIQLGGEDLRYTPRQAVYYWFIPVLNLFRPKQILDELWRTTAPLDGRDTGEAKKTSLTAFWLCALITSGVTGRIAVGMGEGSIGDLKLTNAWLIASCVAEIAAAALAYRLVNSLTTRQELRISVRDS